MLSSVHRPNRLINVSFPFLASVISDSMESLHRIIVLYMKEWIYYLILYFHLEPQYSS